MYEKIKIQSTPRSCNQKKSSEYKSSRSSSSLIIGISMDSGTKLNESIVPVKSWDAMVKNTIKPNKALSSWKLTESIEKYLIKFTMLSCI
jgi:hypothetical protein